MFRGLDTTGGIPLICLEGTWPLLLPGLWEAGAEVMDCEDKSLPFPATAANAAID
jgi:hypothetical protein